MRWRGLEAAGEGYWPAPHCGLESGDRAGQVGLETQSVDCCLSSPGLTPLLSDCGPVLHAMAAVGPPRLSALQLLPTECLQHSLYSRPAPQPTLQNCSHSAADPLVSRNILDTQPAVQCSGHRPVYQEVKYGFLLRKVQLGH